MHWMRKVLDEPIYEPVKRKCGGSVRPEWVRHRFPIKDGIPWKEVFRRSLAEMRNPLFDMAKPQ